MHDYLKELKHMTDVLIPKYMSEGIIGDDDFKSLDAHNILSYLHVIMERVVRETITPTPQVWIRCECSSAMVDAIYQTGLFKYKKDIKEIIKPFNDSYVVTNWSGEWKHKEALTKSTGHNSYHIDTDTDTYNDICNHAQIMGIELISRNLNFELGNMPRYIRRSDLSDLYDDLTNRCLGNTAYGLNRMVRETKKFLELDMSQHTIMSVWFIDCIINYISKIDNLLYLNSYQVSDCVKSVQQFQSKIDNTIEMRHAMEQFSEMLSEYCDNVR